MTRNSAVPLWFEAFCLALTGIVTQADSVQEIEPVAPQPALT